MKLELEDHEVAYLLDHLCLDRYECSLRHIKLHCRYHLPHIFPMPEKLKEIEQKILAQVRDSDE